MPSPSDRLAPRKTPTQRVAKLEEVVEHLKADLERVRHGYARRLKWVLGMLFILILATFAQSYQGREAVINNSRQGCELTVLDRQVTVHLLAIQAQADKAVSMDPHLSVATRRIRSLAAAAEWRSVHDLRTRIPPSISCSSAFPEASPLPWG